jgi:hypothetical protein
MKVHANAALGPAGRIALVRAVESGMTLRAAAAALSVSHPPQPTADGTAGAEQTRQIAARAPDAAIGPPDRIANRDGSPPSRKSRSCGRYGKRALAPADWPGSAGRGATDLPPL